MKNAERCGACAFRWFALAALVLVSGGVQSALATNVKFVGSVAYSYAGNTSTLTANQVSNNDVGGVSGTLKMELWALPSPYTGVAENGYKLAEYSLGQLQGGFLFSNISSGTVPFGLPPNGTWYVAMFLTEYIGTGSDGGYTPRDYVNFPNALVVGPPLPAVSPRPGLWWNPNENGTGYSFDYNGAGTLVIIAYSFTGANSSWYIASGSISGNTFSAPLLSFVNGQCISCGYPGFPAQILGPGNVTVVFSSNTTATMYLPGSRVTPIQTFFP